MAILRFESNLRKGETVALLDHRQMFGRHRSCDCVLNHPTVSREHFFIERTADKFFVVDNDSGNGTYVNGDRVTWIELKEGDLIKSGPFRLRFELSSQERDKAQLEEVAEPVPEGRERGYPSEYLEGIRYFNTGRYFEAHEAWEEIWMRSSGDSRLFFQMLIQAAVCLHHYERGNPRGARGLHDRVLDKVGRIPAVYLSLDVMRFAEEFKAFFAAVLADGGGFTANEAARRPVIQLLADEFDEADLSVAVEL